MLSGNDYQVDCAMDGVSAMATILRNEPDLICLDMYLPDISGLELLRLIRAEAANSQIPIVMITVDAERDLKLHCLESGADEFLNKPLDYAELSVRMANLLRAKRYNDLLKHYSASLEDEVRQKTDDIRRYCIDTVMTLTRAAEFRDENTGCHVARISHYARELAQRLGMGEEFCEQIFYASPMHDIGKLAIPDNILLKRGGLSGAEWDVMKTHTSMGKQILSGHGSPYLEMGQQIAESHHEYWDGSGYPQALAGAAIPLAARIVTLCDVYDALRSKRPYKPDYSHHRALELMRRGDERTYPEQFDPEVLNAFAAISGRFDEIFVESQRDSEFTSRISQLP
ncbi:hypothetical protein Tel_01480 [Candidatus Tenderia electrophaga]|uniref:Two-component system response regulator n=1 Tax=Candidatus Tenderia electrophaga TaxID=1748243 RepID=A0A0S2T9U1_9GAMM|nr:hypothetical protein Tel_01480 [Candidatus Tenderia electrophaga]